MAKIKPLQLNIDSEANLSEVKSKNSKKNKKKLGGFFLAILIVLLVGTFFWKNPTTSSVIRSVTGQGSFLQSDDGRVNILLLGMAGGTHEGASLTDTIMVVSFDSNTNTVDLISLPRDLWLDPVKSKINALYEIGLVRGNGLKFAEDNFSKILGIDIPYAVRMDFSGFIKAVDIVGGIDVEVANSFDDYLYPIEGKETDYCGFLEKDMEIDDTQAKLLGVDPGIHRVLVDLTDKIATVSATVSGQIIYTENNVGIYFPCRYEHISFTKGIAHMNGITALKFVRSRHGTSGEGSDFARSRRQQAVLQAFKEKVLSIGTLTDVNKIVGLIKTFGSSIETDIPESSYLEFAGLVKRIKETKSMVLSNAGSNPLLINPPVNIYGAWVLIPPNNDFTMIKNTVTDFFNGTNTATKSAKPTIKP